MLVIGLMIGTGLVLVIGIIKWVVRLMGFIMGELMV